MDKKFLKKLGMKTDDFNYLINNYIPSQGNKDMGMFIDLGFSTYNYILWKLYDTGCMKKDFVEPFRQRINEVCNIDI